MSREVPSTPGVDGWEPQGRVPWWATGHAARDAGQRRSGNRLGSRFCTAAAFGNAAQFFLFGFADLG